MYTTLIAFSSFRMGDREGRDWPLEPFETKADALTLKHSWEEWLDAFELVLEEKKVESQREKFVLLMTRGGAGIRAIHKNQAVCEDEVLEAAPPRAVIPEYNNAVARLNKYFGNKISTRMEVERFRELKQSKTEDFAQYLLRLRAQANRCNFETRTEDEILQQVTRGAIDEKVRDKRIDGSMTLDLLTQFATGREILMEQKKKEDGTADGGFAQPVMMISGGSRRHDGKGGRGSRFDKGRHDRNEGKNDRGGPRSGPYRQVECENCGSWSHSAGSAGCRASKSKCHSCGKIGHYQAKCRAGRKINRVEAVEEYDGWADETPKKEDCEMQVMKK